jgi:hypothetical protein
MRLILQALDLWDFPNPFVYLLMIFLFMEYQMNINFEKEI